VSAVSPPGWGKIGQDRREDFLNDRRLAWLVRCCPPTGGTAQSARGAGNPGGLWSGARDEYPSGADPDRRGGVPDRPKRLLDRAETQRRNIEHGSEDGGSPASSAICGRRKETRQPTAATRTGSVLTQPAEPGPSGEPVAPLSHPGLVGDDPNDDVPTRQEIFPQQQFRFSPRRVSAPRGKASERRRRLGRARRVL